ncbi:MAG: peptide deformylase [Armatimonadota bacterium]|nr:peptide deformylase [Armatimonadota bacterium]MDR7451791.1 peptide deformylase [Armatimonadota bacterium]MDR7467416.1 peptide deformylase [Armatimonadota bacterium]MDR7494186.1 peptide deformylase [Armatimonadota bacterium]MDR7498848.1 peptide deformylase [Armatimonadota bacterium]
MEPVEIVTVDSPRAAVLRRRARPVGKVTPEVRALIDAMIETMRRANGVGLAAPQVGVSQRLFVAEVEERLHVVIDPQIVRMEGEEVGTEGCLSIPGIIADVPRARRVVVRGKNRRGRGITLEAEGLLARVIQHEVDHLDGVLFLDRVVDRSTIREVGATAEVEPAESAAPAPAGG